MESWQTVHVCVLQFISRSTQSTESDILSNLQVEQSSVIIVKEDIIRQNIISHKTDYNAGNKIHGGEGRFAPYFHKIAPLKYQQRAKKITKMLQNQENQE